MFKEGRKKKKPKCVISQHHLKKKKLHVSCWFTFRCSVLLQLNPLNRFWLGSVKVSHKAKVRAPMGLAVFMVLGSPSSFTS